LLIEISSSLKRKDISSARSNIRCFSRISFFLAQISKAQASGFDGFFDVDNFSQASNNPPKSLTAHPHSGK
jgi:hypothetical protein